MGDSFRAVLAKIIDEKPNAVGYAFAINEGMATVPAHHARSHSSTNVMPGFRLSERSLSRKSGQRLIRLRPEFVVLE